MPDLLGVAFDVLVAVTVFMTALAIGLETTAAALVNVVARFRSVIAVLGINAVVVPVAAFVMVGVLPVSAGNETGVLLCAICACGPLGLKASHIARGDLDWAMSITVIMTVLNVGLLPFWAPLLLPGSVTARPVDLLGAMIGIILLPMVLGLVYRQRSPESAHNAVPKLEASSSTALALAVAVGLLAYFGHVWSAATSWTAVVVVILIALAGPAGYFATGPPRGLRRVSSLVTINRGAGIALLVASQTFAGHEHVTSTVIAFGLLQTIVVLTLALVWRVRSVAPPVP